MSERWEPTFTDTLPSDIRLLSLVDDQEGFRVLLQDPKSLFVYGVYADAVFYRRCQDLDGAHFKDSPPQTDKSDGLMYRIHESGLVGWLNQSGLDVLVHEPLAHYALCFKFDERIDIVCRGEAHVRAAHSSYDNLSAKA